MSSQLQQENVSLKKQVTILRKQLASNKQQLAEQKCEQTTPKNKRNNSETKNTLSTPSHRNHNASFTKYKQMLQIGVSADIIVLQMRRDKIGESLINQFQLNTNTTKFSKYDRMKKLKTPIKSILSQMKLDGLSQSDIDIFCSDLKQSQFGLPSKLKISKPAHKMKNIHWNSIKLQKFDGSIWNEMNHEWADYLPKKIESKFKAKKNVIIFNKSILQTGVTSSSSSPSSAESKQNERMSVRFIETKRSLQVKNGLRLFNYNMTNLELRNAILSLDEEILDLKQVTTLIRIIPTPCEQLMAERMSEIHNIELFGVTERFFYSLCDIIELRQRVANWIFKLQFGARVIKLTEHITTMETAKLIIFLSKELREILKIILAFGNHMNYGNVYGFMISDLILLEDVRVCDNSMTFQMYLCSFLQKKYPNLLHIIERFKVVHEAALINGERIDKHYGLLMQESRDLNAMIIRYKEEHCQMANQHDMFFPKMVNFQETMSENMENLKLKIDSFHKCEAQLIKYFAFETDANSERITIQKIFQYISMFIQQLEHSRCNLKLFEQLKKKIRALKREKQKAGQRRANTENLSRNKMRKYKSKKKQYAISLEDVGTLLMDPDEKECIYENRMRVFDACENKISDDVAGPKLKLLTSHSFDACSRFRKSPTAKKTNIISFGRFSTGENNFDSHSAVIHSYASDLNMATGHTANAAIVHSYGSLSEKYDDIDVDINNQLQSRDSFCLISSNSEMVEQRFGAVLESPIGKIDTFKRHINILNKKKSDLQRNNKRDRKGGKKIRKF